jgi:hypothetical protein
MAKAPARNPAKRPGSKKSGNGRKWSAKVSKHSDALDLEQGVFKKRSARRIALSLKRSAEASKRRKGTPFQSAMSMLTFEINRAGKSLRTGRRLILENAKDELRQAFGRA